MAQADAMEQVKEVVRQLIKYRFWISISFAALFGLIAYLVGAGPVRTKADEETKKIKSAETEVKTYSVPTIPTKEYQQIVDEKIPVLTRDVNTAWKTLYDRQAPLLTWPEPVQERFRKWGRKWPDTEDPSRVQLAQVDYINAYKEYVDMVYKTFTPFDYETGEGIVVAAPKEALLRPAEFSDEHLPGLSKIWAAQERLWIQRTLLEVVAQVNKNANAKDWSSAIIREIEGIEVGNPVAQDQRSLAKNEQLEESAKILAPGETDAPADAGGGAGGGGAGGGGAPGMPAMGRSGAQNQDTQSVFYVKSGNDSQYKVLPVLMTVLIDQDHVQDFLVELENSPMSIQVMDFELQRPSSKVTKPEKGSAPADFGTGRMGEMGGGLMGGMRMNRGRGMTGFGGMMGQMGQQMGGMRGMGRMSPDAMGFGGGGGTSSARKGVDNRNQAKRSETQKKEAEAAGKAQGPSLFDPYFDIVQVTVYGQARFFNPPPEIPAVEPSPGETAAATPAAGATPDATAAAPAQTPSPAGAAGVTPDKPAAPAVPAAPAADGAAPKAEAAAGQTGQPPAPPAGGAGAVPTTDAAAKTEGAPADAGKPAAPDAGKPAAPAPDPKAPAPKP
jgi:hypothetical protein